MARAPLVWSLAIPLLLAVGCVEEQRYVIANRAVALTADAAPAFVDDDGNPSFIVNRLYTLPITPPQDSTLASLAMQAQGKNLPFPRLPWVQLGDLEIQVDYALANLDDKKVLVTVTVDGINEFYEYTPGPTDFHQWERRYELGPEERVSGTITELEMDELATDLATVVNGAPNSNQVVQFQSQSGRDERSEQYIPSVIPGLVAFRAGMMTGEAANLVLELSVRVQDHGSRVPGRSEKRWDLPTPMPFVPVVPVEMQ